jgi:hypothetical protein
VKTEWLASKRLVRAALLIVALCVALTAVMLFTLHSGTIIIPVGDLARMKTLAHEYLNERYRLVISFNPDSNPNVAGAPVIKSSDMSPELAARQKEDLDKLRARRFSGLGDDFATYLQVLDIRREGGSVALYVRDQYSGEGADRYFKFTRKGTGWILTDAKLSFVGDEPPITEPSVESDGKGPYVLSSQSYITKIPEEVQKLDDEATGKILNKWAVNRQTMMTLLFGDNNSYIMGKIVQLKRRTSSDKPDAICFIEVKGSGSYAYPDALLAVTEETKITDQHNDPSTFRALKEGQTVEVEFTIFTKNPWNANAREIEISP